MRLIDKQPTISPVLRDKENGITYTPVRRGRWYQDDQDKILGRIRCSKCQGAFYSIQHYKYCPNCGAKMEEEQDE